MSEDTMKDEVIAESAQAPTQAGPPLEISDEYRASLRYWVLALAGLGSTLLLIMDMLNGISWDELLFALIGTLGGLWALWMATTRVYVSNQGLIVRRFTAAYRIDYQQIVSASIEGRFLSVVTIVFHPRLDDGIIDNAQVGSIIIPSLTDQEELIQQLEARMPA